MKRKTTMSPKLLTLFAAAIALSDCKTQPRDPLTPAAEQQARSDLMESIDNYVRTAPKKSDYRAVLNPRMEALQGDPADPVPSHVGLLKAAPPPPQSGLDAFSPIVVKVVQARLREALRRDPTPDEVVNEIRNVENNQANDIGDQLESRHAEIAAMYSEIASLNQHGKTNEARQRLADLRKLRADAIASWYQAHGVAMGKSDTGPEAISAEQAVTANRDLLVGYLNSGVTDSR